MQEWKRRLPFANTTNAFAMAQCYGSIPLKIPLYRTTWSALHKQQVKHQKGRETVQENGECTDVTNRSSRAG